MKRASNRNIALIAAIVLILGAGIWFGYRLSDNSAEGNSKYSAVYMATGDIYFGELEWLPAPHIKNALYIQRGANQGISVVPMKSVFWGPSEDLYFNPKEMVFWTHLKKTSSIAKALDNPQLLQSGPVPSDTTPEASGTSQ